MITGQVGARVAWWFTDRAGGVSAAPYDRLNLSAHVGDDPTAVLANRDLLAAATSLPAERIAVMRPAHGCAVHRVPAPGPGASRGTGAIGDAGEVDGVDALVTSTRDVGLLALSADCLLVLLADPVAGVVSAVHCGWRGLLVDVAGAALEAMTDEGAELRRVRAVLGPAICGQCYAVPQERVDAVAARRPEAATRARDGAPALDLRAGVAAGLAARGVHVTSVGGCTREDPRWFSFRRDGRTGRHGGLIVLRGTGAGDA